jgi:hypothetical protein
MQPWDMVSLGWFGRYLSEIAAVRSVLDIVFTLCRACINAGHSPIAIEDDLSGTQPA